MGFTSGSKIMADIVDEICAGLIAAGNWSDITSHDPGATMWTTANKTENNAKRALKYQNGSEVIFMSIEVINQTNGLYVYAPVYYAKGFRITFSATWDSALHTYPSSNQQTFVNFETHYYYTGSRYVQADLATLQIQYFLWVESNGFVITGKPEPHANDTSQQSFFTVVERNPNKEYTDGFSNFYLMTCCNIWNPLHDIGAGAGRNVGILRPFAFVYPSGGQVSSGGVSGYGIGYVVTPSYYAFKSNGNGKVYYVKPIINNSANALSPIFQAELWFPWSEGMGLIDGDVIAIEGSTTKFLCKALDSPDSTNRLPFALKYVA